MGNSVGKMAEQPNLSQPNTGARADETPCTSTTTYLKGVMVMRMGVSLLLLHVGMTLLLKLLLHPAAVLWVRLRFQVDPARFLRSGSDRGDHHLQGCHSVMSGDFTTTISMLEHNSDLKTEQKKYREHYRPPRLQ